MEKIQKPEKKGFLIRYQTSQETIQKQVERILQRCQEKVEGIREKIQIVKTYLVVQKQKAPIGAIDEVIQVMKM